LATSTFVVYAALAGNLLVAATKFGAAAVSGSASMLSEGVHSLVDTINEVLLLYGMHRSRRSPDRVHPLGYGRELYFWSFVVAVLLFALGAGVSIYQGITRIMAPRAIENTRVIYIVLALSAVFEGYSWWVSKQAFRKVKGRLSYWKAVRRSKDPPAFMVLFEDSAAMLGIAIVAVATFAAERFSMPELDGVASLTIGLILAMTASVIAYVCKGLLIGEQANPSVAASIREIADAEPDVDNANGIVTFQLGPEQIVVALSLEFADRLRTTDIERLVTDIERKVCARHPEVVTLFVKPQTQGGFADGKRRRSAHDPVALAAAVPKRPSRGRRRR
jgi:cation diffusion facilitator family transporter